MERAAAVEILDDDEDESKAEVGAAQITASGEGGGASMVDHMPLGNATAVQPFVPVPASGKQPSVSSSLQTSAIMGTASGQVTGVAVQGVSGETATGSGLQQPASQWKQLMPQQQDSLRERWQQQQGDSGQSAGSVKRSGGSSQAISFGTLMPMLLPTLQPEQSEKLLALYQKLRRSEISKEDFLRTTRLLVGDQVLVQTVKQMQVKAQPASGSVNLQQVKNEVDKTMASMHLARQQAQLPQHHPSQAPFSPLQAHPSSGAQMQNLASPGPANSQSSTQSQQPPVQMLGQLQQTQQGGQTQLFDAASQQSALSMSAKQKFRKKHEDEEKLLRLPSGGGLPNGSQQTVYYQVSEQTQNESDQTIAPQSRVCIKEEPLEDKSYQAYEHRTQLPSTRQDFNSGSSSQQIAFQNSDATLISSLNSKEFSAQNADCAQNRSVTLPGELSAQFKGTIQGAFQQIANSSSGHNYGVATNTTGQSSASSHLTTSANMVPSPVIIPGNTLQLPTISATAQVRTPPKKPLSDQRKSAEVSPSMQARSKKQKVGGDMLDQSIDQLNDVTAVSGVNLREEEEQLLAGPKEESRTTQAMRKFAQEEEGRLFLEKVPLHTKVTGIAAKHGVSIVSEEVDQCLSMSTEELLRSMLYKLVKLSNQRGDEEREMHKTVVTKDIQRRISQIRKRAKEQQEKKQAIESERIRKLNEEKEKSTLNESAKEDVRTKEKKAQMDEEVKQRANAANVAARAAAGVNDMLIKWQMMAEKGRQKREGDSGASDAAADVNVGTNIASSGGRTTDKKHGSGDVKAGGRTTVERPTTGAIFRKSPGLTTSRGPVHQLSVTNKPVKSTRTISVKDVIAYLETEPKVAKSTLLYRLYDDSPSSSHAIIAGGSNLTSLSS